MVSPGRHQPKNVMLVHSLMHATSLAEDGIPSVSGLCSSHSFSLPFSMASCTLQTACSGHLHQGTRMTHHVLLGDSGSKLGPPVALVLDHTQGGVVGHPLVTVPQILKCLVVAHRAVVLGLEGWLRGMILVDAWHFETAVEVM